MESMEIKEACQIMKEILAPLQKERRVTILRNLSSDAKKTFDELQDSTCISTGSLHEHLNVLVGLGYVHKTNERPARYYRDEYVNKLVQIMADWRAKQVEEAERKLFELSNYQNKETIEQYTV